MLKKMLPITCGCLLLLAACVVPEKFTAEYDIKPNGDYVFTYDGTLVNALSRMAEQGKTKGQGVPMDPRAINDAIKKDPRVKSITEEVPGDTYRVRMEEAGNLKTKQSLAFPGGDSGVWSLLHDPKANTVTFVIKAAEDKDLSTMEKLRIAPDGEIKISTDCKILSSDVKLDKSLLGNTHSFKVNKETLKTGAKIVLQLQ